MFSWYVATTANGTVIRLMLFEIDHLRPVGDVEGVLARLGASQRLVTAVEPSGVFEISTALPDGSHALTVPEPFRQLGELLLLAASTADGREDHFNEMHQRLWIIKPSTGELSVVPQDWFNRGSYDFGHQWITRMARVSESGAIVGEGIRLGVFELDASHRRIAEWLITDTFYQPEREQFTSGAPEAQRAAREPPRGERGDFK